MSITEMIENQGTLEPGQSGYWKVWGARPRHIRKGDIILTDSNGPFEMVEDTFMAKAFPCRVGLVIGGERLTLGALCPVIVLRYGTHNILAD